MRDYKLYLKDILASMDSIEEFIEGMSLEKFREDDKTSSAVIRKFEIIGEAAKHIPDQMIKQSPNIPWKEMAGMRDKLIHLYFGVDYQLVWMTIKERFPKLKPEIQEIIKSLE